MPHDTAPQSPLVPLPVDPATVEPLFAALEARALAGDPISVHALAGLARAFAAAAGDRDQRIVELGRHAEDVAVDAARLAAVSAVEYHRSMVFFN